VAVPACDLVEAPLDELASRFAGRDSWAAYVLGPVALLAREERLAITGLRLLVSSSVPEGKGLGSSAAVEIAVAQATAGALGYRLEPRRLALLGQRAEQLVARAPCGSMDPMTATYGEEAHILALICRPAEIVGSFALPPGLTVWGIDSGARHAVRDAPYRRARCATFMGKALLGVDVDYLTALRPGDVEAERLPERMTGAEFLRLRDGVEDEMSAIESTVEYPVRAATLHPVEEQVRVEIVPAGARGARHQTSGARPRRPDGSVACRLLALRARNADDRSHRRRGAGSRLGARSRGCAGERRRQRGRCRRPRARGGGTGRPPAREEARRGDRRRHVGRSILIRNARGLAHDANLAVAFA
jgi:hypothetical protein